MKFFEALDIPRFAKPDLLNLDPVLTAIELRDRLSGKGFMSYDPLWPRLTEIARRKVTDFEIGAWWRSAILINAMVVMREQYDRTGSWYYFRRNPRNILGLQFKPSVRGVLFSSRGSEAHLINPRKGQHLSSDDIAFLLRAAYEEHCINDPNNPVPVVVDVSSPKAKEQRSIRVFRDLEMMPLGEFERIVDRFFEAAAIAGFPIVHHDGDFTADLFRRVPE